MIEDYYQSPIGLLKIMSDEEKIISVSYCREETTEKKNQNNNYQNNKYTIDVKENSTKNKSLAKKAILQLKEYFEGKRNIFDLPLQIQSTAFEEKVCRQLIKIPYGQKKTYKEIAEKCGSPKAFRAVGNACKKNKILIFIPCHRIVGSNQSLVGFSAGGIKNKEWLLNFEKVR